jgi:hypothetical protein
MNSPGATMTAGFTERTAIEQGFAAVYRERLAPKLESLRRERAEQATTTWVLLALYLAGHVLVVALLYYFLDGDEGFAIVMLFTAGIGSYELVRRRSGAFGQRLIAIVMPEIGRFLGDLRYSPEGPGDSFLTPFAALNLVGSFNRTTVEHHVSGAHRSTGFELVQAHLLQHNRGSKNGPRTVFRGLLIRIQAPVVAPASIRIVRDYGGFLTAALEWFSLGNRKRAHRIVMSDTEFERRFAVYCADPTIARSFVNPGFMKAMLAIDDEVGGARMLRQGALIAAFEGDTFYMAISRRKRLLDTSSLLRGNVSIEEEIHAIFADLTLLHRIIDRLHEG